MNVIVPLCCAKSRQRKRILSAKSVYELNTDLHAHQIETSHRFLLQINRQLSMQCFCAFSCSVVTKI